MTEVCNSISYTVQQKDLFFSCVFIKQLILSVRNLTERILIYYFETAAAKAPSDEGAVTEDD